MRIFFVCLLLFFSGCKSSDENVWKQYSVEVLEVIDGDTLQVKKPWGSTFRVRIYGIDAPEWSTGDSLNECFGLEATEELKTRVEKKTVKLRTYEETDKYGRVLAYVFDSEDVGMSMIRLGFSRHLKEFPHDLGGAYEREEKKAIGNKAGLWGACDF